MDNGMEYAEQRADRLQREAAELRAKLKEVEGHAREAMTLALEGGTPTRELWFWWRRDQMNRGLYDPKKA